MEFHERLSFLRKAAGLTQEQLGAQVGVTRQAVSKWESGQVSPDAATVARLCGALNVSADFLVLGRKPADTEEGCEPEICLVCGRPVEGSICPVCGFPLPAAPPRGPRYAVISLSQFYYSTPSVSQLVRYCGMPHEQATALLQEVPAAGLLLRRDLTDSAAQYLASHLDRGLFPALRIVQDEGEPEAVLRNKPPAIEVPPAAKKSGVGFWGMVLAVIVALLILSFL